MEKLTNGNELLRIWHTISVTAHCIGISLSRSVQDVIRRKLIIYGDEVAIDCYQKFYVERDFYRETSTLIDVYLIV